MQDMQPLDNEMNSGADAQLPTGEVDKEGAMAKADLYKLANYSFKLFKKLEDEAQLEGWVQAKITKAADYIASVYHYLEYEMKFSEYGQHLDNSDVMNESQKAALRNKLMEAKEKIKALKVNQAAKLTPVKTPKHVHEGALSGGDRPCTECGGTGMVYEEPAAIPDHVKGKVAKYNTMVKATKAAHKRLDRNNNGIPDNEEEVDEEFGGGGNKEMKVGDKKKTRTGELTKTSTGVIHKNTSYHDDGDADEKSGKGIKSHAKSQSAAEKKEKAPAQKKSKSGTWGMENGEKFDNRPKEKAVDETYGQGVYEAKSKKAKKDYDKDGKVESEKDEVIGSRRRAAGLDEAKGKKPDFLDMDKDGNKKEPMKKAVADKKKGAVKEAAPSADLTKKEKSAVVKKAKKGGDIGKPGKSFEKVAAKAGGGEKGKKIAAAAMWKNIKEATKSGMDEGAKQVFPQDDDGATAPPPKDKTGQYPIITSGPNKGKRWTPQAPGPTNPAFKEEAATVETSLNESADLARMKQFLTRLNG